MSARIIKDDKGRPITGSEAKTVLRRFYIEPTLDKELQYACQRLRIPVSEGIRRGIILFLKGFADTYYR